MFKIPEERYIEEIEVWKKSSQIHAKKAIEQYKEVVKNIEHLESEKQKNEVLLDSLSDALIVVDENFEIIMLNGLAREIFSLQSQKVLGNSISEYSSLFIILELLISPSIDNIEYQENSYKVDVNNIILKGKKHTIVLLSNITELCVLQRLLEDEKGLLEERVNKRTQELKNLAMEDTLTKLPNRNAFNEKLELLMLRDKQENHFRFTLLFIDIDGFKAVNDTYGHLTGDKLLIAFATYIKNCVRGSDFVARLAGDEFVIILDKIKRKDVVEKTAKVLLKISNEAVVVNGISLNISLSIGILMNPESDLSASMLLSMADKAMYAVKYNGKNSYKFFNEVLSKEFQRKIDLVDKLHNAFVNEEFYFVYQPICDMQKNIASCELLARWNHMGENISPVEFIDILEEQGLITKFTYYMIDYIAVKCKEKNFPQCVSVNLSVSQFDDENFVSYLEKKIQNNPGFSSKISFEITENVFSKKDSLVFETLSEMRNLGFKIYIDDFGTGYSSFDYIRKFPIDVLKIDKVFVDEILEDEKQYKLLKGMVALASSLEMRIIIEGIEHEEQYLAILKLGYKVYFQGYYFHKPMLIEELYRL